MARPTQNTIDYFSHDCQHTKTMYILESRYKNDGYALWFKLLETLGSTPNHFIDLSDDAAQEFMAAKANITWERCEEILMFLAKIKAICPDLWENKIVWCQNFIDRLAGIYGKRCRELPSKPSFCDGKLTIPVVSVTETPQSKLNESRLNNITIKTKKEKSPADFEKSANENLPILEESEIEPSHVEELQPKQSKAEKSLKEKKPNAWGIWVDVNREFGRTDPFASGKDTRAAKSIMSQLKDPEKYADILRQFLEDDDKFLIQNGHSISFLSSKINKYMNECYKPKISDAYSLSDEQIAEIYANEEKFATSKS